MNFIVVDVNVIISSLLSMGDSLNVFILNSIFNKFDFVIPEFFLIELNKHTEDIQKRSKLSKDEIVGVVEFIMTQINIIPQSEFEKFTEGAKEILKGHIKDVPYVALSLKLNCPIFSGDKVLKQLYTEKVLAPREMLDKFYNAN
ncbi:hypothetical protein J4408_03935 [Candidatus Pacearchaeota archaeon]|nr:hypothetical protein [Candidatus Pacearchaeota archaeon]